MKMATYNSELKSNTKKERRNIAITCVLGFALWCVMLEVGFRGMGM